MGRPGEIAQSNIPVAEAPKPAPGTVQSALEELGSKVQTIADVGKEIANLYNDFEKLSWDQTFERFKGIFAMAFLGMTSWKENYEGWKKEHANQQEGVTVIDNNKTYEQDKTPTPRQALVNMKAIKYFSLETQKPLEEKNKIGKKLVEKNVKPSIFILRKSSELFREGVGSYEDFKKTVSNKLVDPSVTDPKERERQAAIILSYCAVGNFQILPVGHFAKMGWSTEGEQGLKDMYEFIKSKDRQVALFRKIISNLWGTYQDPGLVGIAYYGGQGAANGYRRNPNSIKYNSEQYGKHISIHGYGQKIRNSYNAIKEKYPNLSNEECVQIAIEKIESGGSTMKKKLLVA